MSVKSLQQMFKTILERKLSERRVAWNRKQNGLELALFGRPLIAFDNHGTISLGIICGTSGLHGSKDYDWLTFSIGDIEDPSTNPEESIEKVLVALDGIRSLMNMASNQDDVVEMQLIKLLTNSGKTAIRKWAKSKKIDIDVDSYHGHYRVHLKSPHNISISVPNIYKNGSGDFIVHDQYYSHIGLIDYLNEQYTWRLMMM